MLQADLIAEGVGVVLQEEVPVGGK
jgi:hypothetical protein